MATLKLFKWNKGGDKDYPMIAVGEDPLFARVYQVWSNYRMKLQINGSDITLGNLYRFNALDEDSFEGPIETTVKKILKEYGPVFTEKDLRDYMRGKRVKGIAITDNYF